MVSFILPILLFGLCALLLAGGMLLVGMVLGPRRSTSVKRMPYESGMNPVHDARRRFAVRFHLVAIAFLVFDVELLFLYPWAVADKHPNGIARVAEQMGRSSSSLSGLVFCEVMVFIVLLTAGFVYVWRKGVFRWQ